ncbi:MAG: cell wall-binding repeat-containing protein [Atopobiaceae bacterium]|jgi:lactocepin|nr:cell wall-binding repeat-containing protein [Atopobiaceae bacterium]MCI2173966.1 cell wall-binding repeat-containing protein [Atopobiaceae bacterium]MCI2207944.1 cell wall-binding repeat-containing protein [Atopobiaceae bacterium]
MKKTGFMGSGSNVRGFVAMAVVTICVALFAAPASAFATTWEWLYGTTALDTMSAVASAEQVFSSNRGGTVIVATSDSYYDALSASGLAGLKDAPILLTNGKALSSQTKAELKRINPQCVDIIGGTGAVSETVENSIRKILPGAGIARVWGQTMTDTANEIASDLLEEDSYGSTCFIATSKGYQDALSAAPYAYANKCPIFLTEGDGTLSESTLKTIRNGHFTNCYILGGVNAVPQSTMNLVANSCGISNVDRIWGNSAIDTSQAVAEFELENGMTVKHMGVATVNGFEDALSGAALCGKSNSILVLVATSDQTCVNTIVADNADEIETGYIFGGPGAVSNSTVSNLKAKTGGNVIEMVK